MAVHVRTIRDDESDQRAFIDRYAFGLSRDAEGLQDFRSRFRPEWSLAAFDNGEMVAALTIIPFSMRINGRGIPMGGISSVACLPEHRRRGHVGRLLRESLAAMRERGQVLSALYTPHHSLYRRFGWALASNRPEYQFACKDVDLYGEPPSGGRAHRVDASAIPRLEELYRRWGADRTGTLHRSPFVWQVAVFLAFDKDRNDVAVWESPAGEGEGYAVYRAWQPGTESHGQRLRVSELVACTAAAYTGLVRYLLAHDMVTDATWVVPPDDPFLTMVVEPEKVKAVLREGFMLRVVDVPAALAARPFPADGRLVLEVRDPTAPWNEGRWELTVQEGQGRVDRTDADPDLFLDATTLAPLFDGYVRPSAAALTGLLQAQSEEALAVADRLFAVRTPPFTFDVF